MRAGHSQGRAEAARSRTQKTPVEAASPLLHVREPDERFDRAQKHRRARLLAADEIEAPVHAVAPVDIGAARRTEHRRVAGRGTAKAMRRRIIAPVGFGFDDHAAHPAYEEKRADEVARDERRRSQEKSGWRGRALSSGLRRFGCDSPGYGHAQLRSSQRSSVW